MKTLVIALSLALLASVAHAEPAEAAQCTATYAERLADAQQAIAAQAVYMAEWQRVMPWFEAHCRMLTELERAVRKIDDPAAFVCDPKAKGRPKGLTSTFIAEHSSPLEVVIFQEHSHLDDVCESYDRAAGRPSLVLRDAPPSRTLEVICYLSERPSCIEARKALAAAFERRAEP